MDNLIFVLPVLFVIILVLLTPAIRKTKEADRLAKAKYQLNNQLKELTKTNIEISNQLNELTKANSKLTDELNLSQTKLLKAEIAILKGMQTKEPVFSIPPPEIWYEDDYWFALTNWYRQLQNWTCECCEIDLKKRPYFLDTHHIFGRRHNDPRYLKALCLGCHVEQTGPYSHIFMKKTSRYKRFRKTYPDWKCKKCK